MLAEITGSEFYATAAEKTQDLQGKQVFLLLADEERKHLEYLKRQFGHLLKNGAFQPLHETSRLDPNRENPIFSSELRARLNTAHWEITALSVGIALEQASIERYRQLAESAPDPVSREFFNNLRRWEETHAAALSKQFNLLRESYWEQARFAPF